ncbi:MAG: hypothetical protein ACLRR3_06490 [Eubacterium sp.]
MPLGNTVESPGMINSMETDISWLREHAGNTETQTSAALKQMGVSQDIAVEIDDRYI